MGECLGTDTLVDLVDGRADAATRARVTAHASQCAACRAMLSSLARTGGDDSPALAATTPAGDGPEASALASGARIGRYEIVRLLGAGGMGVVYAARDPKLERNVALKVLRAGGAPLHARLEREAQALAQLAHPNVVAVYDVGTFGDRVFVAMELVEGDTLARWLDAPRAPRETLAVLVDAARGLAAAHAAGLVHRDFKPENVLVGADGRVRVADFGLARSTGGAPEPTPAVRADRSRAPEPTPATREDRSPTTAGLTPEPTPATRADRSPAAAELASGADSLPRLAPTAAGAILGTPLYMAPEQYRGEVADARSDQFAFCVVAHRALYGVRPFAGDTYAALEAAVCAGRVDKVPRAARAKVPRRAAAAIARGLAVDPAARWPSMAALIAELAPPSRHARIAIAAGALAAALAATTIALVATRGHDAPPPCQIPAGALAGTWDAARKQQLSEALGRALPSAAPSIASALAIGDRYATDWRAMRAAACEATVVRREQPAEVLALRDACLDDRQRALRATVDQLAAADREAAARAVAALAALPAIDDCADLATLRSTTPLPADAAQRAQVTALRAELAGIAAAREAGHYAAARARVAPLEARAAALAYPPLTAETELLAAELAEDGADFVVADRLYDGAALAADAGRHDTIRARALTARYALLGTELASAAQADALAGQLDAVLRRLDRPGELAADYAFARGAVASARSQLDVAERAMRDGLRLLVGLHGEHDARLAAPLRALGGVLLARDDRVDEAAANFTQALALARAIYGDEHPEVAVTLAASAGADYMRSHYKEAIATYERALAMLERTVGPDDRRTAKVLDQLAQAVLWADDTPRAIALAQRAVAIDRAQLPPGHPQTLQAMRNLASTIEVEHRLPEARALLEEVLAAQQRTLPAAHRATAETLNLLAYTHLETGDPAGALDLATRAVTTFRAALGDAYRPYAELVVAGMALLQLHRAGEAADRLAEAVASLRPEDDPRQAAWIRSWLGRALVESGRDPTAGRALVEAAWPVLADDPQTEDERKSLGEWMRNHLHR